MIENIEYRIDQDRIVYQDREYRIHNTEQNRIELYIKIENTEYRIEQDRIVYQDREYRIENTEQNRTGQDCILGQKIQNTVKNRIENT